MIRVPEYEVEIKVLGETAEELEIISGMRSAYLVEYCGSGDEIVPESVQSIATRLAAEAIAKFINENRDYIAMYYEKQVAKYKGGD